MTEKATTNINPSSNSISPKKPKKGSLLGSLHVQIILAMLLGALVGGFFNYCGGSDKVIIAHSSFYKLTNGLINIDTFSWMGSIFLRLLKLVVIPLVFFALVNGITHMKTSQLGKVGLISFIVFEVSMLIAAALGLFWVNLIGPGFHFDVSLLTHGNPFEGHAEAITPGNTLMGMIPENFFAALSSKDKIPQVILCALVLGIALVKSGDKARSVTHIFEEMFGVMLKIVHWLMKIAPFGVFGMLVQNIGMAGFDLFFGLASYMLTAALGLASMIFIVTPIMVYVVSGMSPIKFFSGVKEAMLTAFATSSTAATIPVSLECVHKKLGVPFPLASFIIPTAATMNMNGAALYEGVIALFLAQAYHQINPNIDLSIGNQIFILAMVLISTLGTPGIPHGGLMTATIVLKAVGLPLDALGLILAVDRVLDMCRTMTNVTGDCASAVMINALVNKDKDGMSSVLTDEGKLLEEQELQEELAEANA